MNRVIKQIRDLEVIEKELVGNKGGVIALRVEDDKLVQIPTPFLYKDKNIFIFFNGEDELYENIQFNTNVTFTIIREEKVRKSKKAAFNPSYSFFATTVSGVIKKIEDAKIIEELKLSYAAKYSTKPARPESGQGGESGSELDFTAISTAVMIDTEEIKAIEETGG